MQLGRVIGNVVSTQKDEHLVGLSLLIVQPLSHDRQPVGRPLVAVDSVGAGAGEHVFVVRGREASLPFHPKPVPTDANIVGIIDDWDADPGPMGD